MTASAALEPSNGTRTVLIIANYSDQRTTKKSVAQSTTLLERQRPFRSNHRCLGLPASSCRGHRGSFDKRAPAVSSTLSPAKIIAQGSPRKGPNGPLPSVCSSLGRGPSLSYAGYGDEKGGKAMYSGVLVTLDGSPLSEAVLPVVADLVAGTKAVVTLLMVGEVPSATIEEPLETVQPFIL